MARRARRVFAARTKDKNTTKARLHFASPSSHALTFNTFRKIGLFPFRFDPQTQTMTHDTFGRHYYLFQFNVSLIFLSFAFDSFRLFHFFIIEQHSFATKPEYLTALVLWIMCELFSVSVFVTYIHQADNLCSLFSKWSRYECDMGKSGRLTFDLTCCVFPSQIVSLILYNRCPVPAIEETHFLTTNALVIFNNTRIHFCLANRKEPLSFSLISVWKGLSSYPWGPCPWSLW